MHPSFREDVDPGVFSGRVEGGRCEGINAIGAIG